LGSGTVEWILGVIKRLGGKFVLDLGCGAGAFLIQMARKWSEGGGIGFDLYADAIAEAKRQAKSCGVGDRVSFYQGRLAAEPIDLPRSVLDKVDTITAMYVLHEFAG